MTAATPPRQRVFEVMREVVSDGLLLTGAGAATYGVWLLSPPWAWIFAGVCAVAYGVLLGRVQ